MKKSRNYTQKVIIDIFKDLVHSKIMLYGGGEHTITLLRLLEKNHVCIDNIIGIIDKNTEITKIKNIKCYPPEKLSEITQNVDKIIVSSFHYQEEIINKLNELNLLNKAVKLYDKTENKCFYWVVNKEVILNINDIPKTPISREIAIKDCSFQINLYLRDDLQRKIFNNGYYEIMESNFIINNYKNSKIVFDIGSNVGYYTLLLSKTLREKGTVYSIEASTDNIKLLQKNLVLNDVKNVIVMNNAVGTEKGTLKLYNNSEENWGQKSLIKSLNELNKFEIVQVDSLDNIIRSLGLSSVDLIKCDIDGGEYNAFKGASNLLSKAKAPDILFEVNHHNLNQMGLDSNNLVSLINSYDYSVYTFSKEGDLIPLQECETLDTKCNLFATKKGIDSFVFSR
ncbi:FkbM family methyltransferase [Evansella cellulosilytica]|uniref:Methyltransferase FkbM family n=1 Tax=Evansella cellulosilytica (strain ATCC 21833 / DSM 2522 / FERM P-1141 / JCM 9156 / N-4) TaxID=649639 RepID=E6TS87_EVAC2|nr:FkbM family methyltransferase [Evansella cellulosilytica]ADU31856.1 methyltransferase FkbM family [Evansella cellulosilytica DSM 2522]